MLARLDKWNALGLFLLVIAFAEGIGIEDRATEAGTRIWVEVAHSALYLTLLGLVLLGETPISKPVYRWGMRSAPDYAMFKARALYPGLADRWIERRIVSPTPEQWLMSIMLTLSLLCVELGLCLNEGLPVSRLRAMVVTLLLFSAFAWINGRIRAMEYADDLLREMERWGDIQDGRSEPTARTSS